MSLTKHGPNFILRAPANDKRARSGGWTWSTSGHVWFTTEPYAALEFHEQGDAAAREALAPLVREYEASYADETGFAARVGEGRALMPFQNAGVEYALARSNVLIGDQPGLGKTAQAIAISNEIGARRTLVICPAAVRLHWRKEVLGWSTLKNVYPYPILRASDGVSPSAGYVITSFDLVSRSEPILRAMLAYEWDHLVIDEAHYLKTIDALRTQAIFGRHDHKAVEYLAERARRITALTGTPLPNRPRECYTLARSLSFDAIDWMSEASFQHRYNPSMRLPSGRVVEKVGRLSELRARLRCNFMVRRLKKQVLKQLPDKTYELTYVEPNGAISKVLRAEHDLVGDVKDVDALLQNLNTDMAIMGHVSTLRLEMGVAKVPRIVEHVDMLLDGGAEKVVVFAHHQAVIAKLAEALQKFGVLVVNGQTPPMRRNHFVEQFQRDPKIRVFLGQLQAAGTGIDGLQNATNHCVFAEASWTPGENEQCVDRLHRHGQKDAVMAQFLVAPGSLDEKIIGRAIEKARDAKSALDG